MLNLAQHAAETVTLQAQQRASVVELRLKLRVGLLQASRLGQLEDLALALLLLQGALQLLCPLALRQ